MLLLLLGVEEPAAVGPLGERSEPLLRRRGRAPHAPSPRVAKVTAKVARRVAAAARAAAAARVGVLLLQRPLLDVVGELRGGHAVRLLAVRLELRGSELRL